jgi:DNA repair protein RadC
MKPLNKYNDLCKEERPEYKGANFGVETLTSTELISMILNRGAGTYGSLHQARQLMNISNENLHELAKKRLDELEIVQGIGHCKAMALMAAIELGKRYAQEAFPKVEDLASPHNIYKFIRTKLEDLDHEESWVILMNNNYKLISAERISIGGITETSVDIRIIVRRAILKNATIVALVHNHPSGSTRPSRDDDRLTEKVKQACEYMRLYLTDHLIVAAGSYYSYREQGRL